MESYHFEKVQADSENLTKFEKSLIIYQYDEYTHSFPLPPPLNLIKIIFILQNILFKTKYKQSKIFEKKTYGSTEFKDTAYIFI